MKLKNPLSSEEFITFIEIKARSRIQKLPPWSPQDMYIRFGKRRANENVSDT
jgi:hypothetical protein